MSRKRALILVRLSSHTGEADPSTSPDRQEEVCRAYCSAHGWEVVEVITDLNVSGSDKGKRLQRPGLVRARELYPSADVLVFSKLDRLARNVVDFGHIREEADRAGVALVSVAEGLDLTTPTGRFIANVLQAFAEMEAATISSRTKEAVAYLAREGRHRGGQPPYGWTAAPRTDGPGFRLVLKHPEADHLREAVTRVTAGESVLDVCDDFNDRGIPGPQRGPWQDNTLRLLLRRPGLRGMAVHHGDVVRAPNGLPIRPHEPLLTDAEWRTLQDALTWTRRYSPAADGPHALLKGLVSCLLCGKRMHSFKAGGSFPQWSCSRKGLLADGSRCPGTVISRHQLEAYVVDRVLTAFGDIEGTEVTLEERADDEVAEVSDALTAVLDRLRDVDDEAEEERLLATRRSLRARLRELEAAPVTVHATQTPTGRTFRQDWDAADDDGKVRLLRSVVAVCAISRGRRGPRTMDPARVHLVFKAATAEAPDVGGVAYLV